MVVDFPNINGGQLMFVVLPCRLIRWLRGDQIVSTIKIGQCPLDIGRGSIEKLFIVNLFISLTDCPFHR